VRALGGNQLAQQTALIPPSVWPSLGLFCEYNAKVKARGKTAMTRRLATLIAFVIGRKPIARMTQWKSLDSFADLFGAAMQADKKDRHAS